MNLIKKYNPYVDEDTFDQLISYAEIAEFGKQGGNSKCAICGDFAVLKTGNIPGHDDSFSKMILTLHDLKSEGANVVPILGYGIAKLGTPFDNGCRYDKGYIVQERASGKELLYPGEFYGKTDEECSKLVMDYLKMLDGIPQQHFDKWVLDYKAISDKNVMIDPSKESNFFYDSQKGFSFIDLNFFTKKDLFNEIDENKNLCHDRFILYTFLPFDRLANGSYNKYIKSKEDANLLNKVVEGGIVKWLKALENLGITKDDVEHSFKKYRKDLILLKEIKQTEPQMM